MKKAIHPKMFWCVVTLKDTETLSEQQNAWMKSSYQEKIIKFALSKSSKKKNMIFRTDHTGRRGDAGCGGQYVTEGFKGGP